jgi:hypothetical protein
LVIGFRHGYERQIAKPGIIDQQVRNFEGRAFFHEGLVQYPRLCRGCVECGEHVPRALPALFGFARDDAGNVGNRTGKEVSGHLYMHLAGNRGKVGAESGGD